MADLFLLAVKSRGEATFEIGERMRCPNCSGVGGHNVHDFETGVVSDYEGSDCAECDGMGYWWMTTHGYRAHPWGTTPMLCHYDGSVSFAFPPGLPGTMPSDAIDLFPAKQSKSIVSSGKSLLQSLGLLPKVVRRL